MAESLGYALPEVAASILKDGREGNENWCEWIFAVYDRNARHAVQESIRNRHRHTGYMASYHQALAIVRRKLRTGEGPSFASWF